MTRKPRAKCTHPTLIVLGDGESVCPSCTGTIGKRRTADLIASGASKGA